MTVAAAAATVRVAPLSDVTSAVPDCVVAAWVDTRTGAVRDQHVVREAPFIAAALDAATEVMRSRERPPRMVLLSQRHVHIFHRMTADPHRVLVVICERSANIGLAVALVRSFADAVDVRGSGSAAEGQRGPVEAAR